MTIVDGWAILLTSSPPSASPLSPQDTEIGELWEVSPSPPGTPATSLFSARMGEHTFTYPMYFSDLALHHVFFWLFSSWAGDEVEIPRIHKPGHTLPYSPKPGGYNSLNSLLEHLKSVAPTKLKGGNPTTPTKQNLKIALFLCSPNTKDEKSLDAEDSMLGQPPSVCAAAPLTICSGRDKKTSQIRIRTWKTSKLMLNGVLI